jgi:hypothetical protein
MKRKKIKMKKKLILKPRNLLIYPPIPIVFVNEKSFHLKAKSILVLNNSLLRTLSLAMMMMMKMMMTMKIINGMMLV